MTALPAFKINHIKNMIDENLKHDVLEIHNNGEIFAKTNRIYKPSHTIEFNREGEVLLYSCDPFKHTTIYFKYPYVFYDALIPVCCWMWIFNPFELEWTWNNFNLCLMNVLWIPHMWHMRTLQYKIQKIYLLRGGKIAKIETQSLSNDRFVSWVENYQFHPLTKDQKNFDDRDNADFLEEEG